MSSKGREIKERKRLIKRIELEVKREKDREG
jgi:hypothetical protein